MNDTHSSDDRRHQERPSSRWLAEHLLNDDQMISLRDLEQFGWQLQFVRQPMFSPSVPVVADPERRHFMMLNERGECQEMYDAHFRNQDHVDPPNIPSGYVRVER